MEVRESRRLTNQLGAPQTSQPVETSDVVVSGERLADPLGQRLRRQAWLLALAAQLLDRDVRRGVDLGPRDDPRRSVLVPHPDVFHLEVEERVARLRDVVEVELVAEVGRVLRQHAEAEEAEDGRVLPLESELELGLVFVQLVEVRHRPQSSAESRADTGPRPGTTRPGSSSASGSRTNLRSWRRGCGTRRPASSIVSSP